MPIRYNPQIPNRQDYWAFQGWSGMGEGVARAGPAIGQAIAERRREKQQEQALRQMLSPGTPTEEIAGMPMSPTAPGTAGFDAEQETMWGEETGAKVPDNVKSAAAAAKAYRDVLQHEFKVPKEALAVMGKGQLQGEVERMILQRQARKDALDIYESNQRMAYTGEQIKNAQELRVSRAAQEGRMNAFQGEMRDLHTPSIGEPGQVGLSPDLAVPPTAMTSEAESNPMAVPGKVMNSMLRTGAWRDPEANQMANAMIRLNVPEKGGQDFFTREQVGKGIPIQDDKGNVIGWNNVTGPNTSQFIGNPDQQLETQFDEAGKPVAWRVGKTVLRIPQNQTADLSVYDTDGDGVLSMREAFSASQAGVKGVVEGMRVNNPKATADDQQWRQKTLAEIDKTRKMIADAEERARLQKSAESGQFATLADAQAALKAGLLKKGESFMIFEDGQWKPKRIQ